MTIGQALNSALSGLSAASRRASVVSNNIANASTEGYSARSVSLAERNVAGVGAGVVVAGVERASAPAIAVERRGADAAFARDDATAGALQTISRLFGEPQEPGSLVGLYGAFEDGLRSLADTPDDSVLQTRVVDAANALTRSVNNLSDSIERVRGQADADIAVRVDTVNDALRGVDRLNRAIARGSVSGVDTNALIDERGRLIDRINENIPVRTIELGDGRLDLATPEGVFLLAGEAREISFTPTTLVTPQQEYAGGAGALSGLSVDGLDITPGGGAPTAPSSGALAGLFAVRDVEAPALSRAVDAFALDIAERLDDPAVDTTRAAGAPGLFTDGGATVDATNVVGLAGRLALNSAVDPAAGGETYRLRDGVGATAPGAAGADGLLRRTRAASAAARAASAGLQTARTLTAAEAAAQASSLAAARRVDAEDARDTSQTFAETLSDAERSVTGVDTDTELQKLIEIEQAYAANARVIAVVDRLIDQLLQI